MNPSIVVLFSVLFPLILNLGFTPLVIRVADRNKWYDRLNARKIHTGNISRIGGIGFFLAFLVFYIVLSVVIRSEWNPMYLVPMLGMFLVFGIGIVDDFYEQRARLKLMFQIVASLIILPFGFIFQDFSIPGTGLTMGLGIFSYLITFLWVIGITNAVNLIDGMDGLAGTVSVLVAAAYGIANYASGHAFAGLVSLGLAGAILGFLAFNRPKARIFMGDGGAYFLGYLLAVLPIIEQTKPNHASGIHILHAITLLLIPIADTIAAVLRRIRKGQPIATPDRHHMHHKMLALGLSPWRILLVVGVLQLVLGAAVVYDVLARGLVSGICLYGSWLVILGFFLFLDRSQYRKTPVTVV